MKKNEKNTSKANNNTTKSAKSVELSKITFEEAKRHKFLNDLSFSQTIKELCAPYAPANKQFEKSVLDAYNITNDSSINCFRAILLDEGGKYKIYRALDKYTTTRGNAQKALKAFETFLDSHEYITKFNECCTLLNSLRDAAAAEEAAKELARKERERAKEAAKIERVTAKVTTAEGRDSMIEQLQKQLAALQNMQF